MPPRAALTQLRQGIAESAVQLSQQVAALRARLLEACKLQQTWLACLIEGFNAGRP